MRIRLEWHLRAFTPLALLSCGVPDIVFLGADAGEADGSGEQGGDGSTVDEGDVTSDDAGACPAVQPDGGLCCGATPCFGVLCGTATVCAKCTTCTAAQVCCAKGNSLSNVSCRDTPGAC